MTDDGAESPPLSRLGLAAFSLTGLTCLVVFLGLGAWQIQRLSWKLKLIAQVEQRLAAEAVAVPGPMAWARIGADAAYRRVRVTGIFDNDRETCTLAVTELGPGCWVVTPLHTDEGWWLLVNRGFVDDAHRNPASRPAGQVAGTVTLEGLLRLSEPGGGFLRHNQAEAGRWYSRDVAAIAAARGLPAQLTAPYFIDASGTVPEGPVGGLTVVRFHNSHLIYALTWFTLAAIALFAIVRLARSELRLRAANR